MVNYYPAENHGWRHVHGGDDEIPGILTLVPVTAGRDTDTPMAGDLLVGSSAPPGMGFLSAGAAGSVLWTDGTPAAQPLQWTISPRFAGYVRVGSASAPSNTTAGDLTTIRLLAGTNAAFGAGETVRVNVASYVPTNADEYNLNETLILAPGGTAGTSNRIGLRLQMLVRPTADDGNRYGGMGFDLQHDSGAFNLTHASSTMLGVNGSVTQAVGATTVTFAGAYRGGLTVSAGTVTTADIFATSFTGSGGTAITTLRHYNIVVNSYPAALTTHTGLNIPNLGNAAVTTAIAIDIAAQTSAGTNLGIRNASNESVASGLRVGSNTTPANTTAGDFTCVRFNIGNGSFSAANGEIIRVTSTLTDTAAGATIFALFSPTITPASASSAEFRTFYLQTFVTPATTITVSTVEGVNSDIRVRSDAAMAELDVFQATMRYDSSSPASVGTVTLGRMFWSQGLFGSAGKTGTITTFIGFDQQIIGSAGSSFTFTTLTDIRLQQQVTGATITTRKGIDIANLGGAGTITNAIAIDIAAQASASTLNFDIRSAGNSVFGGYLRVGAVTAPSNTTAGDLTATRAVLGTDAAMPASTAIYLNAAVKVNGSIGFFNTAPTTQRTSGADLTNNVTSGGTDDTIANFTDLNVYLNDAATIRNDIYQLARKLKQVNDGLRALGLFT